MSAKLVKRLLRQTNASNKLPLFNASQKESPGKRLEGGSKRNKESDQRKQTDEKFDPIAEQVRSMLQFDHAIARRAKSGERVLKKRMADQRSEGKRRKRVKLVDAKEARQGHTPGCAAARKEHERSFDKKRYAKRKEMESLKEIAGMLQKAKKTRKHAK